MSVNESIVEDAALEWFGELGYAVGHRPQLAPGEYAGGTLTPALSHGEREPNGEVVQFRFASTLIPAFSQREKDEESEAILRLNPGIPVEARATHKESLSVQNPMKGG